LTKCLDISNRNTSILCFRPHLFGVITANNYDKISLDDALTTIIHAFR